MDILHTGYDLRVTISRFDQSKIINDWSILSGAWKFLGGETRCIGVSPQNPRNDEFVVRKLHEVLMEADILVGHNADAFDLKKFNTRAIFYDLPPIPHKPSIDTLKVARKHFKFSSNKLAYLARFLKVQAKDHSPDWGLVMEGDRAEHDKMREYNKTDVDVTEQVYFKLRPYMTNHPNLNVISPVTDIAGEPVACCPTCQSPDVKRSGYRYTATRKIQRFYCNAHRGWF